MGSDWHKVRLGDYVDSCLGKMLDKEKNRGELFPYLGNKNVRWGAFELDDLAEMRFEEHEHDRYSLKFGDLIVCEGGEPGRCAIWKNQVPGMKIQKALHRIRPLQGLDNYYLHYWFTWAYRAGLLDPYFTGTTIKHLTGKAISKLEIPLPAIATQKGIANILDSLDGKIALNHQINTTLETMAQTLFKSWFVDFDPVIDNALAAGNPIPEELKARAEARAALGDQRKPLPDHIRQQFPDRFVMSEEMGWVPEGWPVKSLESMLELIGGGTPKTSINEYWNGDIPWFSVVDAPSTSDVFVTTTEKSITQSGLDNSSAKLLRKGTTVISARGTVGKCALVARPMAINQSCYGIIGKEGYSDAFIYYTVFLRVADLQQRSHGSVFSTITRNTFKTIKVPACPPRLTTEYDAVVKGFMERILENNLQSETLSKLRDTLLPKLLSGELRVPEAEAQLAAIL
jgi:type I restriction enzyme S subunit